MMFENPASTNIIVFDVVEVSAIRNSSTEGMVLDRKVGKYNLWFVLLALLLSGPCQLIK